MELAKIPGLTEAVAKAEAEERRLRDLAFLDVTLEICGIEVRQFTPRHYLLLTAAESPFLTGERIGLAHVLQFLWVVSPAYRARRSAQLYVRRLVKAGLPPLARLRSGICDYLEAAWMDARKPGKRNPSASSPIAGVAAHFVHDFGWDCLDRPFAALYQLQRLLDRDHAAENGRRIAFNNALSSRVEKEFLRAWRAEQKAAAAAKTP